MTQFGIQPANRNSLEYTGLRLAVVPTVRALRAPTSSDLKYPIQSIWQVGLNPSTGAYGDEWILCKIVNNLAVWRQIASGNGADFFSSYTQTATSYQVLVTDFIVGVTNTSAPRTITMPAAASLPAKQMWRIKDESGGAFANNITIAATALIDGAASENILTNYGSLDIYWNGATFFTV